MVRIKWGYVYIAIALRRQCIGASAFVVLSTDRPEIERLNCTVSGRSISPTLLRAVFCGPESFLTYRFKLFKKNICRNWPIWRKKCYRKSSFENKNEEKVGCKLNCRYALFLPAPLGLRASSCTPNEASRRDAESRRCRKKGAILGTR